MKLLNVALIAGGGYFVLKYLGIDLLSGLEHSMGIIPGTSSTATPGVTTTPQASGPVTADIKSLIAAEVSKDDAAGPHNLYSVDVWNYYYKKVRGIDGPSPEDLFPGHDRNTHYSLDEYWGAMAGKGFSGLYSYHGMQGMGLVARMNPWVNHYTPGPGKTILPLGSETFVRRFGGN